MDYVDFILDFPKVFNITSKIEHILTDGLPDILKATKIAVRDYFF